jgi:hypothetical protein
MKLNGFYCLLLHKNHDNKRPCLFLYCQCPSFNSIHKNGFLNDCILAIHSQNSTISYYPSTNQRSIHRIEVSPIVVGNFVVVVVGLVHHTPRQLATERFWNGVVFCHEDVHLVSEKPDKNEACASVWTHHFLCSFYWLGGTY